ncbi:MAG: AbrB/MazE/SpoVT family DNA-binding domain-containing protein [Candidatus Hydrogenedentes bacterium]|nr:AbrB/MazE/SpoVT family DNA-binding domain-containing protein [Candidatus Hydrogenedentota bacterium]
MECTIMRNGEISLPRQFLDALHLKQGDRLILEQRDDGCWLLRPRTRPVESLKGLIPYSGPTKTIEDMDRAIAENAGK